MKIDTGLQTGNAKCVSGCYGLRAGDWFGVEFKNT